MSQLISLEEFTNLLKSVDRANVIEDTTYVEISNSINRFLNYSKKFDTMIMPLPFDHQTRLKEDITDIELSQYSKTDSLEQTEALLKKGKISVVKIGQEFKEAYFKEKNYNLDNIILIWWYL